MMRGKKNCILLHNKIILVIFSKIQFTYIVTGFISIRKCACSQTPIVINADEKEQEMKAAVHPAAKKAQKEANEK